MNAQERRLEDLVSIGPAMLRDFDLLGIRSVAQLAQQNPVRLYEKPAAPRPGTRTSAVSTFFALRWRRRGIHNCPRNSASGGTGAANGRTGMRAAKKQQLTTPDLVLLSLLSERPMHGYQANLELERRQVRDWAGVSRPQVYYSLEKLAELGMVREAANPEPQLGPERRMYATTAKGRSALAEALARESWTSQRERPPFLTWIILSWQAEAEVVRRQVVRRREFLEGELAREERTLRDVRKEVGHGFHEAIWTLELMLEQFRTELRWLHRLARELPRRAASRHPAHVSPEVK